MPTRDAAREERRRQRRIRIAARELVRAYRQPPATDERRENHRVPFVQSVQVQAEDGSVYRLLTLDLSPTGLRLVGSRRLLGQKVTVHIPAPDQPAAPGWKFVARILWTCAVGDDLFENGGTFLDAMPP